MPLTWKEIDIFPGQMFKIEAVAVGQRYGIASSIVTAQLLDSNGSNLEQGQDMQSVGGEYTVLHYTVYSNQNFESIKLTVGEPIFNKDDLEGCLPAQYNAIFKDFVMQIGLKECLLGFVFDIDKHACLCSPKISAHS